MKTEPQRICPSCGNELSGATEFCPVCMLRKALADGVESGESSASEEAVKPTPEQVVQRFEHYELVTGEDGKPVELGRGAMAKRRAVKIFLAHYWTKAREARGLSIREPYAYAQRRG